MPIAILKYNGTPNNFDLKIDYVEPADTESLVVKLFDADTNVKIMDLGSLPKGGTTKTYSPVVVAPAVARIAVQIWAVDAAGNAGPASLSAAAVIDRVPPGGVQI